MTHTFSAPFRFWLIALAVLICSPRAHASDTYPEAVQAELGTCPLQCTLCHLTLAGGPGNLNNNFGQAIQATAELSIRQPDSIPAALQKMRDGPCLDSFTAMPVQGGCDSDGDGMGDIQELEEGRDPNVAGVGNICGGPVYGCGARLARGSAEFDGLALLIAAATAAMLVLVARRARKPA